MNLGEELCAALKKLKEVYPAENDQSIVLISRILPRMYPEIEQRIEAIQKAILKNSSKSPIAPAHQLKE